MLLAAVATCFAFTQYLEPRIPQLSELDRFPALEVAKETEVHYIARTRELVAKLNEEPHNAVKIESKLKVVQFQVIAWGQLKKCYEYPPDQRQRCLLGLRQYIGDDAYYIGAIPDQPPKRK